MSEFLDAAGFGAHLKADLARCSYFHVAVSYIRRSGIQPLLQLTPQQLEHSQIITCTDFGITEPEALLALTDYGYRIRCFKNSGLHSKVWILYFSNDSPTLYIGSSNLSYSATSSNIEANVKLRDLTVVDTTVKWFASLGASDLTFDINKEWIDLYKKMRTTVVPQEQIIPETKHQEAVFTAPSGTWHKREGGKTFLAQGIIEGVTQASPSRSLLLNRTRIDHRAKLILLSYSKTGDLYIAHTIDSTLNRTGETTVQFGGGRRQVHQWIKSIWGFDWETSARMNQQRTWQEWFNSTHWKFSDFQYEIMVDLKDLVPTIWVRPILKMQG